MGIVWDFESGIKEKLFLVIGKIWDFRFTCHGQGGFLNFHVGKNALVMGKPGFSHSRIMTKSFQVI